MRIGFISFLLGIGLWLVVHQPLVAADPVTVAQVDIKRYLGTWYEFARLPNAFEAPAAEQITATYSLNPDGTLRVDNQCTVRGKKQRVIGVARIDDPKTNAKLGVSFFEILGFRPVWGDYWILGLGTDYRYSVVGDRSRKFAWILSRTPKLSESDAAEALKILKTNGFDVGPLIYPVNNIPK
ncbi:hypothetical protein EB093_00370 [bacterium]|nr:hypothetical protein [bacterium]